VSGRAGEAPARRRPHTRCGDGAFTLIELLVGIAIIGVLLGIAIPAISSARRSGQRNACKAVIERVAAAVETYQSAFGDFPPTTLAETGAARTNGVNEGAETLVRCLTTQERGGPFLEPDEDELGNTDEDALAEDTTKSIYGTLALFELTDPWGNPYIYYHHRDYRGGRKVERYLLGGVEVRARPRPSGTTGTFPAVTSFVIWSAGPDGVDEGGEGDDVCSWK
jgi:prepilin-type N-terminal cleavage/methylation domain-containing protein